MLRRAISLSKSLITIKAKPSEPCSSSSSCSSGSWGGVRAMDPVSPWAAKVKGITTHVFLDKAFQAVVPRKD
jgi:hypothetical protein